MVNVISADVKSVSTSNSTGSPIKPATSEANKSIPYTLSTDKFFSRFPVVFIFTDIFDITSSCD